MFAAAAAPTTDAGSGSTTSAAATSKSGAGSTSKSSHGAGSKHSGSSSSPAASRSSPGTCPNPTCAKPLAGGCTTDVLGELITPITDGLSNADTSAPHGAFDYLKVRVPHALVMDVFGVAPPTTPLTRTAAFGASSLKPQHGLCSLAKSVLTTFVHSSDRD
ncbi:hypothetical protein HYH02_014577 [Chlamydomonas schloesseri]|uniref:Uncharacterized protein n=1 Tax=Chlamydomonas schloesseri TaxID=2026947 RepID=A0A835SL30_9CHLO|nr:hypothetical protein HYH02_014577 [Chlamydomonas schloesseri]|eukprot:KAG2427531.1 hypothetical protein HYH02_014577 [Chlamydomonas schloesseri]